MLNTDKVTVSGTADRATFAPWKVLWLLLPALVLDRPFGFQIFM